MKLTDGRLGVRIHSVSVLTAAVIAASSGEAAPPSHHSASISISAVSNRERIHCQFPRHYGVLQHDTRPYGGVLDLPQVIEMVERAGPLIMKQRSGGPYSVQQTSEPKAGLCAAPCASPNF
jgi:hypothetical protein